MFKKDTASMIKKNIITGGANKSEIELNYIQQLYSNLHLDKNGEQYNYDIPELQEDDITMLNERPLGNANVKLN